MQPVDKNAEHQMELIKKQYIVDENNRKIAVQISIDDYKKIEKLLEDYALFSLMEEGQNDDLLDLKEARAYYERLVKQD